MSIHGAGLDHRLWVLAAVATHGVLGYGLARLATADGARAGLIAALVPDVDLLFPPAWPFPLVHRGLTHTPLAGAALIGVLYAAGARRDVTVGAALGFGSHLVVDTFTRSGIAWAYPLSRATVGVPADAHAVEYDLLVWAVAIAALLARRRYVKADERDQ